MSNVHNGVEPVIGTDLRIGWWFRLRVMNWRRHGGISVVAVVIFDDLWLPGGCQPSLLTLPYEDDEDQQNDDDNHSCDYDAGNTSTCDSPRQACQFPSLLNYDFTLGQAYNLLPSPRRPNPNTRGGWSSVPVELRESE